MYSSHKGGSALASTSVFDRRTVVLDRSHRSSSMMGHLNATVNNDKLEKREITLNCEDQEKMSFALNKKRLDVVS
jgi:hypothetical protein